jgi:hypothetical protein
LFVRKFREQLVEVSDFQNFLDVARQSDNLHFPAAFEHHYIDARELADSGTVQVLQCAQVEDDVLVAFAEKASDVFAQNAYFEKSEPAPKIDERSLWRMPDAGGKIQDALPGD